MTTILYIGDPNSVHDKKWIAFFSSKTDYTVIFLSEKSEYNLLSSAQKDEFRSLNVELLPPISSFSLWRIWRTIRSVITLRKLIRHKKIDIIHTLFATPYAFWIRFVAVVPSVITTRGSDALIVIPSLSEGKGLRGLYGRLLLSVLNGSFKSASAVVSTSARQIEKLDPFFHITQKAHVVRTGIDVDRIANAPSDFGFPPEFNGRKTIFLPRYIRPVYDTILVLEAVKLLNSSEKEQIALFLINGRSTDAQYEKKVLQELKSLGVPFSVIPSLTQEEMYRAYQSVQLVIMTPQSDGTPNSALEAMAAKRPLILGNYELDKDLFNSETCLQMKSREPRELAELISESLRSFPENLIDNAFRMVNEKGNRQVEMSKLENVYRSILKR